MSQRKQTYAANWRRILAGLCPLAMVAAVTFWGIQASVIIIAAAIACMIIVGTLTFEPSSQRRNQPSTQGDLSWAERVVASSFWAEVATTSVEWLCLSAATCLLAIGSPISTLLDHALFLSVATIIVVACAAALVATERRTARKALASTL